MKDVLSDAIAICDTVSVCNRLLGPWLLIGLDVEVDEEAKVTG